MSRGIRIMEMSDSLTPEALLAQVRWLRALARQLVADPHTADDLAQETCVIALERPPAVVRSIRHWLAQVLRNVMRDRARGERRRRHREERVARPDREPSTVELLRRATLQRNLAALIFELEEPYRSTFLMRYFEELPPRAIAERQGVPLNTVKTRLSRGLERLRQAMDERHGGDRSVWMAAVVPLLERPGLVAAPVATLTPIGLLVMKAPLVLALTCVAFVGTLAVITSHRRSSEVAAIAEHRTTAELDEPHGGSSALRSEPPVEAERTPAHIPAEDETAAQARTSLAKEPVDDGVFEVRGRALLEQGTPLAGVPLQVREDGTRTGSDAGGWFGLETLRDTGHVEAASVRWVTVGAGKFERRSLAQPTVVLAHSIELAGRVVDSDGSPIHGAWVRIEMPRDFESRFDHRLDWTGWTAWRSRTDKRGSFSLPVCPALSGATLYCHLDGYGESEIAAPPESTLDLEIVLKRPTVSASGVLRGRVLSPSRQPVEGARVAVGMTNVLTDRDGRFEVDLAGAVTAHRITATHVGFQPAVVERRAASVGDRDTLGTDGAVAVWPDEVVLVLGPPPLTLGGVVVDEGGQPAVGVEVWIDDPTPFGVDGMSPLQTEYLLAGDPVVPEAVGRKHELPERDGEWSWNRGVNLPRPSALWSWVVTDAHGRFELEGLLDRDYRVKVLDPRTLVHTVSPPLRAGVQNATIVLDEPVYKRLQGRVVDHTGAPCQGVRLVVYVEAFTTSARVFGGRVRTAHGRQREIVLTDEEGAFSFDRVPRTEVQLWARGDTILPRAIQLDGLEDPGDLEVRVDLRCHVQVALAEDVDRADMLSAIDSEGRGIDLWRIRSNGQDSRSAWPLIEGRSEVLSAPPTVSALHLTKNGELVGEIPIRLTPGEIELVRR